MSAVIQLHPRKGVDLRRHYATTNVLADCLQHEARVAALLSAVERMASSAHAHGIPLPRTINDVFAAARAIREFNPLEMS